jgi:hypothetical protein
VHVKTVQAAVIVTKVDEQVAQLATPTAVPVTTEEAQAEQAAPFNV